MSHNINSIIKTISASNPAMKKIITNISISGKTLK